MADAGDSGALRGVRLLALVLLAALMAAGAGIGLYLTRFHEIEMYGDRSATLVNCPVTETVNCEAVNTSPYSELAGIPISALGIPVYLLVLGLAVLGRSRPRLLAYAFSVGILALLYSGYLYYVSSVKIGFLCAWCMRLYFINAAIPVLAGVAAWRSPLALLGEAFSDLFRFPRGMRLSAAALASLLLITAGGDRLYRAGLSRPSAAPSTAASVSGAASGNVMATKPLPLEAAGSLKEISSSGAKIALTPFDLRARVGKGRPVALIFYAPGYSVAEEALVSFARFFREQAPGYEVYAVAGRRPDQRLEMLWESFCLLNLPPGLPLLVDEDFAFSRQAEVLEVPDLVLVNGKGEVAVSRLKGLQEEVPTAAGTLRAEELIRRVAAGTAPRPVVPLPPFYPATGLYGGCAPEFTLPEFPGGARFTFKAASANGKPTFLMFWSATCKHCQQEIPLLVDYVRGHPGEFNLVSVAMIKPDRPDGFSHRKVTEAYIRSTGIPWTVLDDSSGVATDLYRVISTPTTFLISPAGEILDAWYYPHREMGGAVRQALDRLRGAGGACTPRSGEPVRRASFSVLDPDGATVPVESLAGRPSILHLWATWCAPCQEELPGLLKFRKTLEKDGGRLLLVSVEDAGSLDRVRAFGSRFGAGFSSFLAPQGGLAERLDLSYTVPRTFLLSPGGAVIRELYGVQPWEEASFQEKVRQLLQLPGS